MYPHILLPLLQKLSIGPTIEIYTNFPDVIKAGKLHFEKEEIVYLLSENLLCETRHDSFGAFLELSEKAKHLLNNKETNQIIKTLPFYPL